MENYTVNFRQMAGGGIDLDVTQHELEYLLKQDLVEIRARKIRTALLPELVKFHSNIPEETDADGDN